MHQNYIEYITRIIEKWKQRPIIALGYYEIIVMRWEIGNYLNSTLLQDSNIEDIEKTLLIISESIAEKYGASFDVQRLQNMMGLAKEFEDIKAVSEAAKEAELSEARKSLYEKYYGRIFKYYDDRQYAVLLKEKGQLLFRPLSYYQNLEETFDIGDSLESHIRIKNMLSLLENPDWELKDEDGNIIKFEEVLPLKDMNLNSNYLVCCFATFDGLVNLQTIRNYSAKGRPSVVAIDFKQLCERLNVFFANTGFRCECDKVKYSDELIPVEKLTQLFKSGKMLHAFYKRKKYEHQHEFRFLIHATLEQIAPYGTLIENGCIIELGGFNDDIADYVK